MNKHKGIMVVFEGPDGAGKTTILNQVEKKLKERVDEEKILSTRHPGGTPTGAEIRKLLLWGPEDIHPLAETYLFLADRIQTHYTVIQPALEAGKVVLSDRYEHSVLAFQCIGKSEARTISANSMVQIQLGDSHPVDLHVYVTADEDELDRRINGRDAKTDRLETMGDDRTSRMRAYYADLRNMAMTDGSIIIDTTWPCEKAIDLLVDRIVEIHTNNDAS